MSAGKSLAQVALSAGLAVTIAVIRDLIVEDRIMGKAAENLSGVTAKVDKIKTEFQDAVADLKDQLDKKGNLDAEDTAAFDQLNAKLDELDALNPDKPPVADPVPTPADQVVENADTTGEVVHPVQSDIADHIAEGTDIPDPTADDAENPALDGSDQASSEDDAVAETGGVNPDVPADEPAVEPAAEADAEKKSSKRRR